MRFHTMCILLSILAAGCGGQDEAVLEPVGGSGESGTATLRDAVDFEEGSIEITVDVHRGMDAGVQAIHLHPGRCSTPDDSSGALGSLAAGDNHWSSIHRGHVSSYRGNGYYIDIHSSLDGSVVACGDFP